MILSRQQHPDQQREAAAARVGRLDVGQLGIIL